MAGKSKNNISKLDDETIRKVKAIFLRYPVYKQLSEDFKDRQDSLSFEEMLSYHCSSDIENIRTTRSRSRGGQPENDALNMIEKSEKERHRQEAIKSIENSILKSLKSASKIASPQKRDAIAAALYSNLCLGVPVSMLCCNNSDKKTEKNEEKKEITPKKIAVPTLLKYRNEAICFGAINFGFVPSNYFEA